ncbi:uncharacterized protein TNCV_219111 [Trichonephila clavipes]|nr:uncharacterized protein TNCV_219111 [Trichonephila clavipes]
MPPSKKRKPDNRAHALNVFTITTFDSTTDNKLDFLKFFDYVRPFIFEELQSKLKEKKLLNDHPNDQDPATDVNPAQTPYHDISIQGPYLTLAFPLQALFKCPVSAKPEIGLPVDSPSRGTSRPFIRSRQLTPTSSASYANSPSPRCRHRTLASRRHYSWQNATSNQSGNVASVVSASHQKLGLTTMSSPTRKHLLRRTTSQLKSGPRRAPSNCLLDHDDLPGAVADFFTLVEDIVSVIRDHFHLRLRILTCEEHVSLGREKKKWEIGMARKRAENREKITMVPRVREARVYQRQ